MNKTVFYIIASLFSSLGNTQNLVPNGDFEYYTQCPDDYGQIQRAYPWYNPNSGSSDYYNSCVTAAGLFLDVRIPQNTFGYQYPYNGNGYAGFGATINTLDYYEYIATPLTESLIAGQDYCVSFRISLADNACLSVNRIGVYFTTDSIYSSLNFHLNVNPQIVYSDFISNKEEWILIEESFVAQGGEKFLTVGTFDTTGIKLFQLCNDPLWLADSYYYIDDVVVQLATESCNSEIIDIPNVFSPNGDGVNDIWKIDSEVEVEVSIINRWGSVVFEQQSKIVEWKGDNVSEGVYYYIIKRTGKQRTGFIQVIR